MKLTPERLAEIERLRKDLELTRGAMDAQDRREREAGEKCSVSWLEVGCDWPDWVADEVLSLRANVERLKKDNSGLHEIQDLQREHIVERDRRIAGLEKELAEARKLSDEQYQFALATQTENESLRDQLAAASESHRAIQGLERLGYKYGLYRADTKWVCELMIGSQRYYLGTTPDAAVNAALEAAGKETV